MKNKTYKADHLYNHDSQEYMQNISNEQYMGHRNTFEDRRSPVEYLGTRKRSKKYFYFNKLKS
jgi:hypothetical protein